jgi:hypothetical protein
MTIAAPDFPCLWAEAVNIAAYPKNRLPTNHLLSSINYPLNGFMAKTNNIIP